MFRFRTLFALLALAAADCATTNPAGSFSEAARPVAERTALEPAWPRDEASATDLTTRAKALLAEPLDPDRAAQVALWRNPGLLADLEDLGISQAEYAQAMRIAHPSLDFFYRRPDQSGLVPNVEIGLIENLLDPLLLPLRNLVTNRLPEHTSVHWHGILLPAGMDGVSGLNQPHIKPGETYAYEFTLRQWGTQLHPKRPENPPTDRDFCIFPHMWAIDPDTATPNPNVMLDFNLFTFNGRAWPGTESMICRLNDRVRIRIANLSMTSHPLHIHGVRFWVTQTDGGPIPKSAWWPETSVDVAPGQTRAVEFVSDNPGDWIFHCHKTHHAMNAMGHKIPNVLGVDTRGVSDQIERLVSGYMTMGTTGMSEHAQHQQHLANLPNTLPMMTGEGPFGPIEMGGMFTLVKVREGLESYGDPGWYDYPEGTVARRVATPDELKMAPTKDPMEGMDHEPTP